MKISARTLLTACLLSSALAVGCSVSDENANASDDALHGSSHDADAELADMLAHVREPFTEADAVDVLRAAIAPGLTTKRLKMVNEFAGSGYSADPSRHVSPSSTGYDSLTQNVQIAYGSVPRDLKSTPEGFGGQTLEASIDLSDPVMAGDGSLKVTGTASRDYALDFTLGDHTLHIRIPAGSTPKQTADLIEHVATAERRAIEAHMFDEIGIGDNRGDSGGSDGYVVSVDGDTVKFNMAING